MYTIINSTHNPTLRVALFVAWKCAARWADVLELSGKSFVQLTPTQIVVAWDSTKTTSAGDFRAWRWTVIHDRLPMDWVVQVLETLGQLQPLTRVPTSVLPQHLQKFGGDFTAHSIKRGALDHLVREAVDGKLDIKLIPLLAKHQDPSNQFPASTLRYIQDKVALALLLGSQKATILL
jgi:hypothetical protein